MRYCKIIIQALSYLPGTFIHELSHYVAAVLFARPTRFHLIPRIEGGSVVFGSVSCEARHRVAFFFVAMAPLVWWYVLYRWLVYIGVVAIAAGSKTIHFDFSLLVTTLKSHLIWIWLMVQLLWAGRLSMTDLRVAVRGILSFSGLAMIALVAVLYPFRDLVLDLLKSIALNVPATVHQFFLSGKII